VTLISASAGSGKSTLLRSWIDAARVGHRTAWVSIERGEQDAQRFWLSALDALRDAAPEAQIEPLAPAPYFDGKAVVEGLVRDLQRLRETVVLVLDDLHELTSAAALETLSMLLSRRPRLLAVVLSTRHDPSLRLHRLRLSGELTEIRDADLRFDLEQTHALLAASGIALSDDSVSMLYSRTEGWVAGLCLAIISLEHHPQPERFIADFSGSERTVAEYLLAEVLERQPPDVREFLLRTSVLEQVNGELADVLVGRTGSERILQTLEADNSFVTSVDPSRSWFQYHHLFANLLRLELRKAYPDEIVSLHRTAVRWYADHGRVIDAIRHALQAQDWSDATQLLSENYFSLSLNGQDATVNALLVQFPAGVRSDPELTLLAALTQLSLGSLDEASGYIAIAERKAASISQNRRRRFGTALAVAKLTLARLRADFTSVLDQVRPLLEAPTDAQTHDEIALSSDLRALALMNLGIAEKWSLRYEEGEAHLLEGLELAKRIGRPYVQVGCLAYLGLNFGNFSNVAIKERCEQAIALAEAHGWGGEPILAAALSRLGGFAAREGRYDDAEPFLDRAQKALRAEADPAIGLSLHFMRAGIYLGRNRADLALAQFEAATRLRRLLPAGHPYYEMVTQHLVHTQVRVGDLEGARATLAQIPEEQRGSAPSRVAAASVRFAEGNPRAAVETLAPVLDGSVPAVNIFTKTAALLIDAQARDVLAERDSVHEDLERVLEFGEREALIPAFAIAPPSIRGLLERHLERGTAHRPLLTHILDVLAGASATRSDKRRPDEELSEREMRVLRYLPTNLTAPEIGAELGLSHNTIKTHMREIYAKLEVHSRSEAVERARKLGLTRIG
jgi:LuxR family transcriptional regulator, maltose regulon positive regulatory protein